MVDPLSFHKFMDPPTYKSKIRFYIQVKLQLSAITQVLCKYLTLTTIQLFKKSHLTFQNNQS